MSEGQLFEKEKYKYYKKPSSADKKERRPSFEAKSARTGGEANSRLESNFSKRGRYQLSGVMLKNFLNYHKQESSNLKILQTPGAFPSTMVFFCPRTAQLLLGGVVNSGDIDGVGGIAMLDEIDSILKAKKKRPDSRVLHTSLKKSRARRICRDLSKKVAHFSR